MCEFKKNQKSALDMFYENTTTKVKTNLEMKKSPRRYYEEEDEMVEYMPQNSGKQRSDSMYLRRNVDKSKQTMAQFEKTISGVVQRSKSKEETNQNSARNMKNFKN